MCVFCLEEQCFPTKGQDQLGLTLLIIVVYPSPSTPHPPSMCDLNISSALQGLVVCTIFVKLYCTFWAALIELYFSFCIWNSCKKWEILICKIWLGFYNKNYISKFLFCLTMSCSSKFSIFYFFYGCAQSFYRHII